MQIKFSFILSILILVLFLNSSIAQNGNYWTQQYGNKSLLLGGAVTGSVSDLGSVYYNPGFIALTENPSFMITAKLLQLNNINIENGLGDNKDLNKTSFSAAPGLIAGVFTLPFFSKSKFAYSYLTRRTHNLDFVYKTQAMSDILPFEGEEDFSANVNLHSISKEYWGGWSWSYPLTENMAVGLSNFISVTNTKSLLDVNISAITADQHIVTSKQMQQYEFNDYGMIFKFAYAIKYPKFSAGITITPPKIHILGSGYMYTHNAFSGADSIYTPSKVDLYEADYQEDLQSKLRSPLSIAMGAGYKINKLTLHFSIEWFDKVKKYTIMEPSVKYGQSTNQVITYPIVEELSSVVNGGFAVEYKFKGVFQLYSGVSTDFSAARENRDFLNDFEQEVNNTSFKSNIYHFSGGVGVELRKISITLGLSYNYGIDYISSPANLPNQNNSANEATNNARIKIDTWKLLFGFALPISKNNN